MVINGESLLLAAPIVNMEITKVKLNGVSYGLSEAGYDIRIKQDIFFTKDEEGDHYVFTRWIDAEGKQTSASESGKFAIASAIEEFRMPNNLMGIVHDKSTWARRGLSVFNTVIEPGWDGFLTLELVYHGNGNLIIPAGSGIAQVIFHETKCKANYTGKYHNQPDCPVKAILE
jgi:dCTP deaminase